MRLRSLFLVLRRSPAEVIEVTEVIGYRSRPKKRATRVDSKVSDLRSSLPIQEVLDLPVGLFNVRKYMRPAIHSSISWMVSVEDLQVRPCLLDLISKGPNT